MRRYRFITQGMLASLRIISFYLRNLTCVAFSILMTSSQNAAYKALFCEMLWIAERHLRDVSNWNIYLLSSSTMLLVSPALGFGFLVLLEYHTVYFTTIQSADLQTPSLFTRPFKTSVFDLSPQSKHLVFLWKDCVKFLFFLQNCLRKPCNFGLDGIWQYLK